MANISLKSKVEPMLVALGQNIKQRRIALGMSQEEGLLLVLDYTALMLAMLKEAIVKSNPRS